MVEFNFLTFCHRYLAEAKSEGRDISTDSAVKDMSKHTSAGIYLKGMVGFLDFFSKDQFLAIDVAALMEDPYREMGRVQK